MRCVAFSGPVWMLTPQVSLRSSSQVKELEDLKRTFKEGMDELRTLRTKVIQSVVVTLEDG